MTNAAIIFEESQKLAEAGTIEYTGRIFSAEDAEGNKITVKETEEMQISRFTPLCCFGNARYRRAGFLHHGAWRVVLRYYVEKRLPAFLIRSIKRIFKKDERLSQKNFVMACPVRVQFILKNYTFCCIFFPL